MTEAIKKAATKSWKTTLIGILGAIAFLAPAAYAALDGNPETVALWPAALAGAGTALGIGVNSRDHSVTSEEAGIK